MFNGFVPDVGIIGADLIECVSEQSHRHGTNSIETSTSEACNFICKKSIDCDAWTRNESSQKCFLKTFGNLKMDRSADDQVSGFPGSRPFLNNVSMSGGDYAYCA